MPAALNIIYTLSRGGSPDSPLVLPMGAAAANKTNVSDGTKGNKKGSSHDDAIQIHKDRKHSSH